MILDIEKFKIKWENLCREVEKYKVVDKVDIVIVSKYLSLEDTERLVDAGFEPLGENRVQVLREKNEYLKAKGKSPCWHFIGQLQTNKVKYLSRIDNLELIHSVDSLRLVDVLEYVGAKREKKMEVLIEVNTSGESSKAGILWKDVEFLEEIMEKLEKTSYVKGIGFMTMAPFTDDEVVIRECFRKLAKLKDKYQIQGYEKLSMGMSNDYKIALQEGANIIRIGSYLYE